ncbi:MAG: ZIP family metal transporter [Sphingobacteriaceae bacterium]|nr:ZIP family metal transporter [Sphingobacteriaceae bacterium]
MNTTLAIILLISPILIAGGIAFKTKIKPDNLRLLLALSAAYLFSVSIIHLLPEAYAATPENSSSLNVKLIGLFIVLGFCLQLIIDTFSTGIEHGHVHLHSHDCHNHLPAGIIVGLFLHSFLEGLPLYNYSEASNEYQGINHQLIYGLIIHNIPISIAFVLLLKEHEKSSAKTILYLVLFSVMTPLGFLFSYVMQSIGINGYAEYSKAAFALVIGIFLHLSTAILFETSDHHKYNVAKVLMMATGIILAYLIS